MNLQKLDNSVILQVADMSLIESNGMWLTKKWSALLDMKSHIVSAVSSSANTLPSVSSRCFFFFMVN